ncbi:MAG TPA: peptidyl-prolyl cis-trans isomerase [Solirubrobacteraceae bacterium]|jgi:foldase protein PrsA|nr:peptidyl-prolyl cis-trans isomerase [Solirubrobacteraceae bacterium]
MNSADTLRRRVPRLVLAALSAALLALTLAACGGDSVPSDSVAKVGDERITKKTFDHWMRIAAISARGPVEGDKPPAVKIPQPPDFKDCVAEKTRTAPKPPKGQPKPTPEQLKAQCKQEYEGMRDSVMQLLIQEKWVSGEAAKQGVKVTDAEVRKAFEDQKKQSFPKKADYDKFLRTSGFTEQDVLFRVRLEQLANKLREKVLKGKDKVTDAQIKQYYDKNKERFAQPERRDLRVVLTKTEDKADAAKRALQDGQSWKKVAKKYSIDQASKNQGGSMRAVAKGQQEPAFDEAVFKAKKGELVGPVKTQFGFYVLQVQKVTPAQQQSLEQAREAIKGIVASENQQKALTTFVDRFQKEWRGKTKCRSGYVTADCSNAPKTKTTNTVPPGAVPQPGAGQAPTPQAPPGAAPPQGGAPPQQGGTPPQGGAPPEQGGAPPQGAQR